MTYNLTSIANVTGVLEFTQNINNGMMEGWLGIMLLMGLGVVLFSSFLWSTRDASTSAASTSFILFIFSLILAALQLVQPLVVFVCMALAAFSVAFLNPRSA